MFVNADARPYVIPLAGGSPIQAWEDVKGEEEEKPVAVAPLPPQRRGPGRPRKIKADGNEAVVSVAKKRGRPRKVQPVRAAQPNGEGMSMLDAAVRVLTRAKEPMGCREIIETASEKGFWTSPAGKTPWNTLSTQIRYEIERKGTESRFSLIEKGKFTVKK